MRRFSFQLQQQQADRFFFFSSGELRPPRIAHSFQTSDLVETMDNKAVDQRKNAFKSKGAFQPEQVRNRRQQHSIELRKQKREENLSKRRNLALGAAGSSMADSDDELESQSEPQVSIYSSMLVLVNPC